MLERPDITDAALIAAVAEAYGVALAAVEFLPLGADAAAWVFRGDGADGRRYLLKLRRGAINEAGLMIPRYLADQGLPHIVAPLAAADGRLWAQAGELTLTLHPFIEGGTAADVGLTPEHWRSLGGLMRQLHTLQLPPELAQLLREETWAPEGRDLFPTLEAAVGVWHGSDVLEAAVVATWRAQHQQILTLIDRVDQLGQDLRAHPAHHVLCHADLHTWNMLVDADGALWVIDWDAAQRGLPERDLMFVVGGIGYGLVRPEETERFLEGYGDAQIDGRALAYYRCAWAIQDMLSFAAQVLLQPDTGPEDKRWASDLFVKQFAPGNMVEIALDSPSP